MKKLIHVSKDLEFNLSNGRISYLFRVSPEGILEHIHFGGFIKPHANLAAGTRRVGRGTVMHFQGIDSCTLSDVSQEYPLFGTSDMRQPALHCINADGNSTNILHYKSHRIADEKPVLDGLPSAREGDSETLLVTLEDQVSGIEVELSYTVYEQHDVIARSVTVTNKCDAPINLTSAYSTCLELPAADYELLHLRGTWAREFNVHRLDLPAGRFAIDAASGTSGNHHNPFMAIMDKGASEQLGNVYGMALVYSGNFCINVEQGEFDAVRVCAGLNPFNFNWKLEAGESFTSPEALQVYSPHGINGMSHIWHAFIREHISPLQFRGQPRPTYLNSWEAAYFDIDDSTVLNLADKAKSLGLEMLVVDDGWFEQRNDDTTSLGDWFSDIDKFPDGIEAVAEKVQAKGLKFGLWFEPEMVNPASKLYQKHPDWIVHTPHRTPSTGRGQYILDLSRSEVVDYIFNVIDMILSSGHIDYVKWDMNRVMSEIGSAGLPTDRQLETPHRYMLGVYDLVNRLTTKHPKVLFENCASGGNRFDLGMLSYMAQGWTSDMSEPIGRLAIINGATHIFPLDVLASYIGPVPSHQNDRRVSLKTRAEVGFFCGARGLSLNLADIDQDQKEIMDYIDLYNRTSSLMMDAQFYRLRFTENEVCWQLVSNDGESVFVGYYHILSAPNLALPRIQLTGLDANGQYQLVSGSNSSPSLNGTIYGGDSLMQLGLNLPYVAALRLENRTDYMDHGDFSSRLYEFKRLSD